MASERALALWKKIDTDCLPFMEENPDDAMAVALIDAALAEARREENEACATLAVEMGEADGDDYVFAAGHDTANAIRERVRLAQETIKGA